MAEAVSFLYMEVILMYCEKCNKNNIMSEVVLHQNTEDLMVNNTVSMFNRIISL